MAVLGMAGALPAAAHDTLISSDPAQNAVLPIPPTTVTLRFDQEIAGFEPELAVTVGSAAPVMLVPRVAGPVITADLGAAGLTASTAHDGIWKLGYRVVSIDGHPVTGLITFTVGPPGSAGAAAGSAASAPTATGTGSVLVWSVAGAVVVAALALGAALWHRRSAHRRDSAVPQTTASRDNW